MSTKRLIFLGYDPRENAAFAIARESCRRHMSVSIPVYGLVLRDLQPNGGLGWYRRPIEWRPSAADKPVMWDVVSDAPMSTEHANARFFVPKIARRGWALFADGDVLFRGNVCRLFDQLDNSKALFCVKHDHEPAGGVKMDGQVQTQYARKNWSSVMAFNCDHPANAPLFDLDFLNTTPGRDLHRMCWLDDEELIGELHPCWNHLVGHSDPNTSATIAHFTSGVPDMPGYENQPYAEEWFRAREEWARGASSMIVDLWARP